MGEKLTVCFTGHRDIPEEHALKLPSVLYEVLEKLIAQGAQDFYAGGAIGFDTLSALCVLDLKETHPELKLHLILPCRNQTAYWDSASIKVYNYIQKHADTTEYISDKYYSGCMHERNRRLVDCSQICVAYLTGGNGGTAYTCNYAEKKGVRIINTLFLLS